MFTSGEWIPVIGEITDTNVMRMRGGGYVWTMIRKIQIGWPLPSSIGNTRISQAYACFDCAERFPNQFHSGIDMRPCKRGAMPCESPVFAAESGSVCDVQANDGSDGGFGNAIIIRHENGRNTLYAHLKEPPKNSQGDRIRKGATICRGATIGRMGNTGNGLTEAYEAAHLHFAFKKNCKFTKGYTARHPNEEGHLDPWTLLEGIPLPTPIVIEVVTSGSLGVREGPSKDFNDKFAEVHYAQRFVAYAQSGDWYLIHLPCGYKSQGSGGLTDKACAGWVKRQDTSCSDTGGKCLAERAVITITPPQSAVTQTAGKNPLQANTVWKGEIRQRTKVFPTTIYINERNNEHIRGEIHFKTERGLYKLTFQGNVVEGRTVAWITDKKEGLVTFPGLYIGTIKGKSIAGVWQVPSAGQYDTFSVKLVE
jgi:hypothetical protein